MKTFITALLAKALPRALRERLDRRWTVHYFINRSAPRAYLFALTGVWL